MLSIKQRHDCQCRIIPNILPCRVNHDSPVKALKRYWSPIDDPMDRKLSFFRGRKLRGKVVKLPTSHRGALLSATEKKKHQSGQTHEGLEDNINSLEEHATFSEFVVWGHEAPPDDIADSYIRGIREWITFASDIHSYTPFNEPGPVEIES